MLTRLLPSKTLRQKLKNKVMKLNLRPKPPLETEVRERFGQEYREDILKLQDLIQRDLSQWLVVSS